MKTRYLLLVTAALGAMLPTAYADDAALSSQRMEKMRAKFAAADTNHDGRLTKAEAQAGMPQVAAHFDEIDTAHSGSITLDQIAKFVAAHQQ